jgi:hypothetical protein
VGAGVGVAASCVRIEGEGVEAHRVGIEGEASSTPHLSSSLGDVIVVERYAKNVDSHLKREARRGRGCARVGVEGTRVCVDPARGDGGVLRARSRRRRGVGVLRTRQGQGILRARRG